MRAASGLAQGRAGPGGARDGGSRGIGWPFWIAIALGVAGLGAFWRWAQPEIPRAGKLYVADPFDDRLVVVDLASGQARLAIKVGRLPHQLAVGPDKRLYVAEAGSQSISLVDPRHDTVVLQRIVGEAPANPAHQKKGMKLVQEAKSCKACHGMRVVGSLPASVALGLDGKDLWVTETRARRVSRLSPGELHTRDQVAMLGGELTPSQVLVHPTSGDLYVAARTYKGDMPTGPTGPNLKISADPEHAAASGVSAVTAFDSVLHVVKGRLELPFAGAYTGVFARDGRELYLACRGADRIAVIGLAPLRILRAYAVAPGPAGIALADPETLVVASFNTDPGVVQFLDRKSGQVRQVLTVPANPAALAVHPRTGQIYVGCAGSDQVLEIDARTRTVVRKLDVNAHASGLAVVD